MKYNNNKLPQHLHEILIGFLLGDGGIFYGGKRSITTRFEFSMGQNRLAFAEHLAYLFKDYASNPLKVISVKATADGDLIKSYRFKTQSLSVFNYYRDLFYIVDSETGKVTKIVPSTIYELFTPLSFAYLIMSDGNYDMKRNRVRIYTNCFTEAEVKVLAMVIKDKFDIYTAVMKDKPRTVNQFILTIGAKELSKLRILLSPHMHPSMKYRIGI